MDPTATPTEETAEAEGWAWGFTLSYADIFLFGVIVYVIFYYYNKHTNKEPVVRPSSYNLAPRPGSANFDGFSDGGSFIAKMKRSAASVIVFYGSQTGTAEEFAGRLAKEVQKYGLKSLVADPEEYTMEELERLGDEVEQHLAIFCMATYGEGDPTDNAGDFYQMLIDQEMDLSKLNYTVFALGNKTYEHYNATGRYVDKRLKEMGANCVYPKGEGDDDANMEDDFIMWKDDLWPVVCEMFGVDCTSEEMSMRQYDVTEIETPDYNKVFTGEINRLKSYTNQRFPFDVKNPFLAKILVNRELHKGGDRNCLHMELDITDSKIRYDAGDHVAIYPVNRVEQVERMCALLGKDPETIFTLTNRDEWSSKKHPFPCPCSYRTALSYYLDISAPPRTHILKELIQYTESAEEKERLLLITNNKEEGRAAYHQWVVDSSRSILHILEDLPTCRPPLDYLCEMLPRLQARYYSISSSSKVHPTSIHVTAVVLKYQTLTERTNYGVCTNWLLGKVPSEGEEIRVPVFVRKSQFRLPVKSEVPVIMIGPGTGIAPFRGFLQERAATKAKGSAVGETILYFGCRHEKVDYIYSEELREFEEQGAVELRVAFSRDQDHKVYVQHLVSEDADRIWEILDKKNGHLYVCGDAKNMAREVNAAIIEICVKNGGKTKQQAEDYVKNLINKKRYSSDVWS